MSTRLSSSSAIVLILVLAASFAGVFQVARAQNQTRATTDPDEARAVNAVFARWEIEAATSGEMRWNISGEVCSGAALGSDPTIDDQSFNPSIKCDCSFNNNTLCRVTALKVSSLDISGPIPDDLWTLTFLTNLNLGLNFLSGTLSPSIGNLTRMQYLNLGTNQFTGPLPREIGLLTDLRSLGFGSNNFNGSLPSELGSLSRLEQMYFDSAGVSGPIPSTFADLTNLATVWGSDNAFTGRIPDFIGSWTSLTTLRLEGNAFDGPIPSSFSNLTALTELRIGGITNGTSSLEFIRGLTSLSTLVLRDSSISGTMPSDIWNFPSLSFLDLSFNRISGTIPAALFNMSSLTFLFLGNNRLNGTLPDRKSPSLVNIDVSYNNLGGNLPSWVNATNQLNIVFNNFTIDPSNTNGLPSGINCLQQNFPCNRNPPIYSQFSIKCGGPSITTANPRLTYERDNETLGPATYFVPETDRWGVSNVGLFAGSNNPQYRIFSSSQFTNTLDSELFQTARLSASSLRYYGLGLENGNYTVTLHFSETAIVNGNTWRSLGRRLFDVYIQGNRVLRDFDIKNAAGGVSTRAVQRNFTVRVSENYMDIHLYWAGKGTCCIPAQGVYGPSISAISALPDFVPTVSNNPPSMGSGKHKTGVIVGIVIGILVPCSLLAFAIIVIIRRKRRQRAFEDHELEGIDTRPYTFSYAELRGATKDFSASNKLGEGGFGPVYLGKLDDGRVIAVKQLSVQSHQGKSQFIAEIATISAVQHRNLVKLYGCCIEGENRLLVYEYLENKSLDKALFEESSLNLDWPTRYDICLGIARGLAYLHEESRLRIVHRDVKASNILLDSELVPKISDFGLAKLYDDKKTHISTRVAGTIGYLAPEYAMRGHLTEKADVFAFGVVALEIVSGRPNSDTTLDEEKMYLLEWAWHLHENNREVELADSRLPEYDEDELKRFVGIALLCTQASPSLRPSMSRVVAMLSGDVEVGTVSSRPGYLTDWKFDDTTTSSFTSDSTTSHYNSSTNTTVVTDPENSPLTSTKPMLHGIIGEGR
ncbi:Probable LRR receptor-like serine/threonine-protein kinase At1g56130 [Linum perenne]